jgi:hypothetical protein
MYLALATYKEADTAHIYSIVRIVIPTVLKLLGTLPTTPLHSTPSKAPVQLHEPVVHIQPQELVVNTLSGFFAGDSVKIDDRILREWAKLSRKSIAEIEIESANGRSTQWKVKEITDAKHMGKGIVRIPEKACRILEVKEGETVTVQPVGT